MKTLYDTIAEFISGDWGCEAESDSATQSGYCIRAADIIPIETHDYSTIPQRFVSQSSFDQRHLIKGDIVIEKSGGSPTQSTGRAVYISQSLLSAKRNIICSNFCTAIRLKPEWNPYFVYQYWRQVYNSGVFFNYEGKTSGLKNLQLEVALKSIPIPEIDLPTQLRIAGVLGSIDEKIELNRRKIAELEALAKTIYDYWFVQFDFPDANGRPYKSSGGKMVWNEQLKREVPGGWEVRPLSTFSERITKGTTPTSIGCSFTNKGVRFIKVENIMNGTIEVDNTSNYISEQTDSKMARSRLCESDLLITIAGRLGDVAIVPKRILPANTNQAVGIVRLNQDSLPIVHYLSMYLSTVQMKTRLQTMNAQSIQKNLNLENVGQIDILCEYAVMSKFENYIRPIRENLECLHEEIETLTMQRDELLPLLMNGQVKVG